VVTLEFFEVPRHQFFDREGVLANFVPNDVRFADVLG
jgi:hypothetical protein